MEKVKLTRSSGNVFRDLGFSGHEAEYFKVRAELMVNLQKVITARGLKQAQAARGCQLDSNPHSGLVSRGIGDGHRALREAQ